MKQASLLPNSNSWFNLSRVKFALQVFFLAAAFPLLSYVELSHAKSKTEDTPTNQRNECNSIVYENDVTASLGVPGTINF